MYVRLRCRSRRSLSRALSVRRLAAAGVAAASAISRLRRLWGTPGWLPDEIGVIIEQGQFFCYEGEDLKLHLQRGIHNITVYSLIGVAADVDSGQHQKSHLVSVVNVAHSMPIAPAEDGWHLFNDFLVRPTKREEALSFNPAWKLPSVLTFQIKSANNLIDDSWKTNLDTSLLYQESGPNPSAPRSHTPLNPLTERPNSGTILALDTEFVSIRQPEIEINSDGDRATIRPIVYALARVSVVR
ncbi:hypothetical protein V491_03098, partial [Pseudogymnoascus sp. VKM F-3775]